MQMFNFDKAVATIKQHYRGPFPKTALILGSGLGRFGETMDIRSVIDYSAIPDFPVSTVAGHSGRFLIGKASGLPLICMQGRMHLYEGYPASRLAIPIRTLRLLGVNTLVLTNAAGSLRKDMGPGSLMLIEDHINFSGQNPLAGANDKRFGERFFDMSHAYDADLRTGLLDAAGALGLCLHKGIYVQVMGPNFETPAEVRMFGRLGADAVGMSTVPECLVANHAGMRVAGLSVITNLAAGIARHRLSHEETMREGSRASNAMERLLNRFFAELHAKEAVGSMAQRS